MSAVSDAVVRSDRSIFAQLSVGVEHDDPELGVSPQLPDS